MRHINELTIWCNNLEEAKKLLDKICKGDEWNVKEPIKRKWNWKRFQFEYKFKITKMRSS